MADFTRDPNAEPPGGTPRHNVERWKAAQILEGRPPSEIQSAALRLVGALTEKESGSAPPAPARAPAPAPAEPAEPAEAQAAEPPKPPKAPEPRQSYSAKDLGAALQKAHAAGDTEGAQVLANALREQQLTETTLKEKLQGSLPGRVMAGAGLPGIDEALAGLAGRGAEASKARAKSEKGYERGREWWKERGGGIGSMYFGVPGGLAESVASYFGAAPASKSLGLPSMKTVDPKNLDVAEIAGGVGAAAALSRVPGMGPPKAAESIGKIAMKAIPQGAIQGGYFGATSPTGPVQTEQQWRETKARQAGLGAEFGGGVGALGTVALGVGKVFKHFGLGFEKLKEFARNIRGDKTEVASRLLGTHIRENLVGNEGALQQVRNAVGNVQELLTNAKGQPITGQPLTTVAESLVRPPGQGIPGATGLMAHQQHIAQMPGASRSFNARWIEREGARQMAQQATEALAAPLRTKAMKAFETMKFKGGMGSPGILGKLGKALESPDVLDDVVAHGALNQARQTIATKASNTFKVDVLEVWKAREALHEAVSSGRVPMGGRAAGLVRATVNELDDALGKFNPAWKDYVRVTTEGANKLEAELQRHGAMYTPPQTTRLRAGEESKAIEEYELHVLNKHVSIGNWLIDRFRTDIQREITRVAEEAYLHPDQFLKLIETPPENMRGLLTRDLWNVLFVNALEPTAGKLGGQAGQYHDPARRAGQAIGATP